MARSSLRDPLDKFRWTVSISGFSKLGFHQTSIPSYRITNKNYKEGGAHLTPRKIVNTIDYGPVTLARGVTNDTSFNKWATGFIDKVTNNAAAQNNQEPTTFAGAALPGVAAGIATGALNNGALQVPSNTDPDNYSYRRDVKIEHVNRIGQVEVVYMLYNAYPIEYKPASDFDAFGDDSVSIETLVLDYESMEVLYPGFAGTAANLLS